MIDILLQHHVILLQHHHHHHFHSNHFISFTSARTVLCKLTLMKVSFCNGFQITRKGSSTPGDTPVDCTHVPGPQGEPRSLLDIVSSRGRPDARNNYKTRSMGYLTPTPSPCTYGVMKTIPPWFQRWWCLQTPWVWGHISPVRSPPRSCG